jgi:hypothetical protein
MKTVYEIRDEKSCKTYYITDPRWLFDSNDFSTNKIELCESVEELLELIKQARKESGLKKLSPEERIALGL